MRCVSLSLLWLIASPLAAAQEAAHHCAKVSEPVARLACYDTAFPLPPEVVEAAMQQAQDDFGLDGSQPSRVSGNSAERADSERIESRVIKIDHGRGGQRSFNLENGQVWTQADARSSGHVQDGQVVQVRRAILSGYQLVTPAGVTLRVRRAR